MLLQFSVKNYKTFKDKATLSLIASNYDKGTREDDNVIVNEKFGLRILKSAVVYGANASGKSKLFDALSSMRYFAIFSSKIQKGEVVPVQPFRLSSETENEPSEFEVIFIFNDVMYRYGFEATEHKVISEWLYFKPEKKEIELFYRDGDNYETHKKHFSKGGNVAEQGLVRDNALLLSVAANFNEKEANSVISWFYDNHRNISGLKETGYQDFTMRQVEDIEQKTKILSLLKAADLGIRNIGLQKLDVVNKENHDEKVKFVNVLTMHKKYDSNKKTVENVTFSLFDDESSGTEKFFFLTGPILNVLENGYTLIVDELDSKLHPNLVNKLVSLFNSKEFNPKNAQLIFNTHDTNLLNTGLFRRDQVWFTEKNRYGEAKLYSLADFKSIRKTDLLEDNYINGKYGAIPFLGYFDDLNNLPHYEDKK